MIESRARRTIRRHVEAKGYTLAELTWEPWGPGGWWLRVEPDPSPQGSSGLDWFGGLSWQETVTALESLPPLESA